MEKRDTLITSLSKVKMKNHLSKAILVFIVASIIWACNNESGRSRASIVDPDFNYIVAKRLKEIIDSSKIKVYNDSLLQGHIDSVKRLLDMESSNAILVTRSDSISYEIIVIPPNYNKQKEDFYLVTQDSIYLLVPHTIKDKYFN
ncbi:hypothetical protein H7F15_16045 [Pontibacter sp. Tf4]|uniref:hypothetical protein n=1 Tax=Pontibacter sp. Tf4 TaxID=2761620 RepID=UPI0016272765|nr:hypothetical protein [Pontibacter sp. Tf4]MBB6612557.1 hypothetical protein [Pontibacter sp. Tf4]